MPCVSKIDECCAGAYCYENTVCLQQATTSLPSLIFDLCANNVLVFIAGQVALIVVCVMVVSYLTEKTRPVGVLVERKVEGTEKR